MTDQIRCDLWWKSSWGNNVTYRIGLAYAENNTELSRPIRPSVVYDETRQNNDVTNLPDEVYAENKTK